MALKPRTDKDSEFVDYVSPMSKLSIPMLEQRLVTVSRRKQAFDASVATMGSSGQATLLVAILYSDFFWEISGVASISILARLACVNRSMTRLLLEKNVWMTVFENMSTVWLRNLRVADEHKNYLIQQQGFNDFLRHNSRHCTLMRLQNLIDFDRETELREHMLVEHNAKLRCLQEAFDRRVSKQELEDSQAFFAKYNTVYFCVSAVVTTPSVFSRRTSPLDMFQSSLDHHGGDVAVFLWHQFCNAHTNMLTKLITKHQPGLNDAELLVSTPRAQPTATATYVVVPTLADFEAVYGNICYKKRKQPEAVHDQQGRDQTVHGAAIKDRWV